MEPYVDVCMRCKRYGELKMHFALQCCYCCSYV